MGLYPVVADKMDWFGTFINGPANAVIKDCFGAGYSLVKHTSQVFAGQALFSGKVLN